MRSHIKIRRTEYQERLKHSLEKIQPFQAWFNWRHHQYQSPPLAPSSTIGTHIHHQHPHHNRHHHQGHTCRIHKYSHQHRHTTRTHNTSHCQHQFTSTTTACGLFTCFFNMDLLIVTSHIIFACHYVKCDQIYKTSTVCQYAFVLYLGIISIRI